MLAGLLIGSLLASHTLLSMIATLHHSLLAIALITLLELAVIARILLRPHRDPASRIAWMVVVGVLPLFGMLAYLLLGEVNIGRRRVERLHAVLKRMRLIPFHPDEDAADFAAAAPERHRHLFRLGHSISGFHPAGGNTARLLPTSNATIDAMAADIDSARDHVHVLFYIWLPDNNGTKVVEALKRAAARGVTCRAMADDLGSRMIIRSEHWQAMRAAGVRVASGLPIGNPCCGRSGAASTSGTIARSSSSTIASPTAAARTVPIPSSE